MAKKYLSIVEECKAYDTMWEWVDKNGNKVTSSNAQTASAATGPTKIYDLRPKYDKLVSHLRTMYSLNVNRKTAQLLDVTIKVGTKFKNKLIVTYDYQKNCLVGALYDEFDREVSSNNCWGGWSVLIAWLKQEGFPLVARMCESKESLRESCKFEFTKEDLDAALDNLTEDDEQGLEIGDNSEDSDVMFVAGEPYGGTTWFVDKWADNLYIITSELWGQDGGGPDEGVYEELDSIEEVWDYLSNLDQLSGIPKLGPKKPEPPKPDPKDCFDKRFFKVVEYFRHNLQPNVKLISVSEITYNTLRFKEHYTNDDLIEYSVKIPNCETVDWTLDVTKNAKKPDQYHGRGWENLLRFLKVFLPMPDKVTPEYDDFLTEALTEGKADTQKLITFAGKDIANRFLAIRNKFKAPENDLYFWIKNKTPNELEQAVLEMENAKSNTQIKKETTSSGAKLVADTKHWKIYHITSFEAAQAYGRDTKWCITGIEDSGDKYWNEYKEKGADFYFLITKDNYDPRGRKSKFALALYEGGMEYDEWEDEEFEVDPMYEVYDQQDYSVLLEDVPYINEVKIPGINLNNYEAMTGRQYPCEYPGCHIWMPEDQYNNPTLYGKHYCAYCHAKYKDSGEGKVEEIFSLSFEPRGVLGRIVKQRFIELKDSYLKQIIQEWAKGRRENLFVQREGGVSIEEAELGFIRNIKQFKGIDITPAMMQGKEELPADILTEWVDKQGNKMTTSGHPSGWSLYQINSPEVCEGCGQIVEFNPNIKNNQIFFEPFQLKNGHKLCSDCMEEWIKLPKGFVDKMSIISQYEIMGGDIDEFVENIKLSQKDVDDMITKWNSEKKLGHITLSPQEIGSIETYFVEAVQKLGLKATQADFI